jgi:hypothetical protein
MPAAASQCLESLGRTGNRTPHNGNRRARGFLIRLALPDGDLEPFAGLLEISDVQGNELGAAECAGKAEQEQSAVSECGKRTARNHHHRQEPFGGHRRFLGGSCAGGVPDASYRGADALVIGRQRQTGKLVSIAQGGNPAADGRRPNATLDLARQEGRHHLGRGRQFADASTGAPCPENPEIGRVGALRGLGLLLAREIGCFFHIGS